MDLLGINKKFSILFFSAEKVRGGLFVRTDRQWKLVRYASVDVDSQNPSVAWKQVTRSINSKDGVFLLSGAMQNGVFFQFDSANLSAREQSGAVELELPRKVMQLPEDAVTEFAYSLPDANGQVRVGVYVFPGQGIDFLEARMTQANFRADGFIYPFFALEPEDPELYLPEIEKDFAFANGAWKAVSDCDGAAQASVENFRADIDRLIQIPDVLPDFNFAEALPMLLAARMVASGKYDRCRNGLAVLPEKLRPVRFRKHIIISIVLVLLLVLNTVWSFSRTWGKDYSTYQSLRSQISRLKHQISTGKRNAKKSSREIKDMQRVIAGESGDPDVVAKLAVLSNVLPGNVLVSSIRWSDSGVDMVLQSEDDKLNLPALINPLGLWRIGQLQQRQTGDSTVATITLKLVPIVKSVPTVIKQVKK